MIIKQLIFFTVLRAFKTDIFKQASINNIKMARTKATAHSTIKVCPPKNPICYHDDGIKCTKLKTPESWYCEEHLKVRETDAENAKKYEEEYNARIKSS